MRGGNLSDVRFVGGCAGRAPHPGANRFFARIDPGHRPIDVTFQCFSLNGGVCGADLGAGNGWNWRLCSIWQQTIFYQCYDFLTSLHPILDRPYVGVLGLAVNIVEHVRRLPIGRSPYSHSYMGRNEQFQIVHHPTVISLTQLSFRLSVR